MYPMTTVCGIGPRLPRVTPDRASASPLALFWEFGRSGDRFLHQEQVRSWSRRMQRNLSSGQEVVVP